MNKQEDETLENIGDWSVPIFAGFILTFFVLLIHFGVLAAIIAGCVAITLCWIGVLVSNYRIARQEGESRGWALLGAFLLTILMFGG